MLNKVILIGRITNDIEIKKTKDDISYTYFTIAVNRTNQRDKTDFVSCVAWRGTAEFMDRYLSKGSLISVEGRIEVFTTQKDGNYLTRTNINVQQVNPLESKAQAEARKSGQPNQQMTFSNDNTETNQSPQQEPENTNNDSFEEIEF